jgi:WD40 repeat protein
MTSSIKNITQISELISNENEPYVGPRPFTREDRDIFFGRYRETLELTSLIKAHPEVLLYAQSGAGKTSLIYAQLIPTLDLEEEFDVLPPARVRSQQTRRIADQKIRNIYMFNALRDLSNDKLSLLQRAQMTLAEYLAKLPRPPLNTKETPEIHLSKEGAENQIELRLPRALIFDQFEEIFTLYQDRYKDRLDFFRQVAEALEADPFLRVVFSMREDYIAELDPYIDVLPQKLSTRFRLEPLRKPNAIAAVTKPLEAERITNQRVFGDSAAESLVESLMMIKVKTATGEKREVPGEFVDPVQLQVVCQTLWEKLPPTVTTITEADLKKYANVDEALLTYYENSVRKAVETGNAVIEATATSKAEQAALVTVTEGMVRRWFEQFLITREGKRNMVFRGDKRTGNLQNEIVDELDKQHLIRGEMRGDDTWYELSHDRFISPIKESNQRWLRQQPLAKQKGQELEARAIEWQAEKDPSLLLDRVALLDAQKWRQSPEADAIGCSNELELLIRQSEAAIEQEDRKQIQELAVAQHLRANAEHQRAKQFKLGLVLASFLLVIALTMTIYAYKAEARATRNYTDAQLALIEATDAKAKAVASEQQLKIVVNWLKVANDKLNDQTDLAVKAKDEAVREKAAAVTARGEAEGERAAAIKAKGEAESANAQLKNEKNESLSLKLASDADARLSSDPELGLRLALRAVDKWPKTPEARYSLRQAYLTWPNEHFILRGHERSLQRGIFSPDGRLIITTSQDLTTRVWDAATKKEILPPLTGHKNRIFALAISSDGTRIATEGADGTARIWWLNDGSWKKLEGLTGPYPAIAFSHDGKLLATEGTPDLDQGAKDPAAQTTLDADKEGFVAKVWDAEDKNNVTPLRTLIGHDDAITSIAFSPQEYYVATASRDKTARIWDAKTGVCLKTLRGHTAKLNKVAFDPTGKLVVTASDDSTARVWEINTGKEMFTLQGHLGFVIDAVFSPNGESILTVTNRKSVGKPEDNVVRVWDAHTGLLTAILSGHTKIIRDATFSADSRMIVTASDDGTARVWNAGTGSQVMELKGHGGSVSSAVFSPDNRSLLTAGTDHTAQLWRIPESALEPKLFLARRKQDDGEIDFGRIDVGFDSDQTVASVGTDGELRFWNAQTLKELKDKNVIPPRPEGLEKGRTYLTDIQRSHDGRYLAMALRGTDKDSSIKEASIARVWDTVAHKYINLIRHKAPVYRVVFSPRGKYLLTASEDGTAVLWDTSSWTAILTLTPKEYQGKEFGEAQPKKEAGEIRDAAFDPSERYVVTAHENGTIQLWEIASGAYKQVKADKNKVLSVAFNRGGNLIVTGGSEGTAKLWTLALENISVLSGHTRPVLHVEFSNDGNFIVTSSGDNTVRVWETETAAPVQVFESLDIPMSATLSSDNKYVAVGGLFGFGEVFPCEACRPFEEIKDLANRSNPRQLTKAEKKQFEVFEEGPTKKN